MPISYVRAFRMSRLDCPVARLLRYLAVHPHQNRKDSQPSAVRSFLPLWDALVGCRTIRLVVTIVMIAILMAVLFDFRADIEKAVTKIVTPGTGGGYPRTAADGSSNATVFFFSVGQGDSAPIKTPTT